MCFFSYCLGECRLGVSGSGVEGAVVQECGVVVCWGLRVGAAKPAPGWRQLINVAGSRGAQVCR